MTFNLLRLSKDKPIATLYKLRWVQHFNCYLFDVFPVKKCDLDLMIFYSSMSSKVKSDCVNRRSMAAFKKVLPGVQPRISHSCRDISNQRILTLTPQGHPRSNLMVSIESLWTLSCMTSVESDIVSLAVFKILSIKA